jgi:hypothetical protein
MRLGHLYQWIKTCSAAALLLACLGTAHAYTLLDVAILDVSLPPGWKMTNATRKPGMIIMTYTHTTTDTQQPESLVAVELTKEPNKDAYAAINEMAKNVSDQALSQHCQAEELVTPTKVDNPFRVWSQTFQCKPSKSGIVQMYVDADAQTIYLLTYTIPGYPFTAQTRSYVKELLKSSIQICYKDKPCTSLMN